MKKCPVWIPVLLLAGCQIAPITKEEWIDQRLGDSLWMNHWEYEFVVTPWYTNGPPEQAFLISEDQMVLLGDGGFEPLAKIAPESCAGLSDAINVMSAEIRISAAKVAPRRKPKPPPGELEEVNVCLDGVAYELSLPGIVTLYGSACRSESFIQPALNVLELARACAAANKSLKGDVAEATRP